MVHFLFLLVIVALAAAAQPISSKVEEEQSLMKRCCGDPEPRRESVIKWFNNGESVGKFGKAVHYTTSPETLYYTPPPTQKIHRQASFKELSALPTLPSQRAPLRLPSIAASKGQASLFST